MGKGNKQGHNWGRPTIVSQSEEFKILVSQRVKEIGGVSSLMKLLPNINAYQTVYRYINGTSGMAFEATEKEILTALGLADRLEKK